MSDPGVSSDEALPSNLTHGINCGMLGSLVEFPRLSPKFQAKQSSCHPGRPRNLSKRVKSPGVSLRRTSRVSKPPAHLVNQ